MSSVECHEPARHVVMLRAFSYALPWLASAHRHLLQHTSTQLASFIAQTFPPLGFTPKPKLRWQLWWHALRCEELLHHKVLSATLEGEAPMDGLRYFERHACGGGMQELGITEVEGTIRRDIERTFQHDEMFQSYEGAVPPVGQDMLANVLGAMSKEVSVGYCQGMNYVAAVLIKTCLAHADTHRAQVLHQLGDDLGQCSTTRLVEAAAFWALLSVVEQPQEWGHHSILSLNMCDLWGRGVPGMKRRLFEFRGLLRKCMPLLAEHFSRIGLSLDVFISQWFGTLFCYSLPYEVVVHTMGAAFSVGWPAMHSIGLACLKMQEKKLLSLGEFEEVRIYIKKCSWGGGIKETSGTSTLMQAAESLMVSKVELTRLARAWAIAMMHERVGGKEGLLSHYGDENPLDSTTIETAKSKLDKITGNELKTITVALMVKVETFKASYEAARLAHEVQSNKMAPKLEKVKSLEEKKQAVLAQVAVLLEHKGEYQADVASRLTALSKVASAIERELADFKSTHKFLRQQAESDAAKLRLKEAHDALKATKDSLHTLLSIAEEEAIEYLLTLSPERKRLAGLTGAMRERSQTL